MPDRDQENRHTQRVSKHEDMHYDIRKCQKAVPLKSKMKINTDK